MAARYDDIYAIAPQMRDYAARVRRWRPYLMYSGCPDVRLPAFSTDAHGFRYSAFGEGRISVGDFDRGQPVSVVVGGSSAFGVGARSDAGTFSSGLSRRTGTPWLNAGTRAFNQMQEVLSFILYSPEKVDSVVMFSGVNNLILAFLSDRVDTLLPPIFHEEMFLRRMEDPPPPSGRPWRAVRELFSPGREAPGPRRPPPPGPEERYGAAMAILRRCLGLWSELARSRGFRLHFVLQPFLPFHEKQLSSEERALFSVLDQLPQVLWSVYRGEHGISGYARRYREDLSALCGELGIPFSDLNRAEALTRERWLYVDRIHLTDEGYQLCAELVAAVLTRGPPDA